MTEYKVGDRVRITLEGVLEGNDPEKMTNNPEDGLTMLSVRWGTRENEYAYIEDIPASSIEKLSPTVDGLYYNADPKFSIQPLQMSLTYKLDGGHWYDNQLNEIDASALPKDLIPLKLDR